MPAGSQTVSNSASVWTDLTKLSPMVWLNAARVTAEEVQPVMDIWDVDPLNQFNRDYSTVARGGFGKVIQEGQDYVVKVHNQGDTLGLTAVKRGDAYTITEDLLDGNKYREIEIGMRDLGSTLFKTRARDATHHLFTFGFSTSYTDAEGNTVTNGIANASTEAIFADTHTMADGSTYDNNLADAALGETNLRNLHDLTTAFIDEDGYRVPWGGMTEKILVTSNDVPINHTADRMTTQPWEIDSTDRNKNIFAGQFRHLPLFFLNTTATPAIDSTKDKYYYILDQGIMKDLAVFGDHQKPTLTGPFEDMFNGGMLWRAKTRFDKGVQAAHVGAGCPATS